MHTLPLTLNNKSMRNKRQPVKYEGSKTKNSLIGNTIRLEKNHKVVRVMELLGHKMKIEEVRALARKHKVKLRIVKTKKDVAWYDPNSKVISLSPDVCLKVIVSHELGHAISHRNPKSYNSISFKYTKDLLEKYKGTRRDKKYSKKELDEMFNDNEEYRRLSLLAEEEAWEAAYKISPELKDQPRLISMYRKHALGTYRMKYTQDSVSQRVNVEDGYAKKLALRSAKKVGGAIAGGVAGMQASKLLSKNYRDELSKLQKEPPSEENTIKITKLYSKIIALDTILSGAGAVAGYAGTKKFLTKSI